MYATLQPVLQQELADIEANGLLKRERIITSPQGPVIMLQDGSEGINLCANNYLGLSSHPKVLEAGGVDSSEWSGFAFGMGFDRIIMIKYGIDDVRLLYSGDLRFTRQF